MQRWRGRPPCSTLCSVDDTSRLIEVIEAAQKLPDSDLREVIKMLNDELKHRYKRADQLAAMALNGGYWVETTGPGKKLPLGAKGHIVEIRRERVDVHFPDYGMFTVSASLLRKTDAPPEGATKPESGA